jgi:hypothetical protein
LPAQHRRALKAAAEEETTAAAAPELLPPPREELYSFDAVDVEESFPALGELARPPACGKYNRPAEGLAGVAAVKALDRWLSHGLRLYKGGADGLPGLVLLYELLCGSLKFGVLSTDSSQRLGALLLRLLPIKDLQKGGHALILLRVLAANPKVAGGGNAPPLVEPRDPSEGRLGAMATALADTVMNKTGMLFERVHGWLLQQKGLRLPRPPPVPPPAPPLTAAARQLAVLRERGFLVPRGRDVACAEQTLVPVEGELTETEVWAFASTPLREVVQEGFVEQAARFEAGLDDVSPHLPVSLVRKSLRSQSLP